MTTITDPFVVMGIQTVSTQRLWWMVVFSTGEDISPESNLLNRDLRLCGFPNVVIESGFSQDPACSDQNWRSGSADHRFKGILSQPCRDD